jgi:hypothetical protein
MRIAPELLDCIKPAANYVILEPIVKPDEIQYKSISLYLDTSFERTKYMPVVCRVVAICKNLVYDVRKVYKTNIAYDEVKKEYVRESEWVPKFPNTMPWDVRKQVKHDDIVFVNYYPLVRAFDANDPEVLIYSGDKTYFMLHYSDLYCVKNEDDVTMLNGFILLEPLPEEEDRRVSELKKLGLWLPEKENERDRYAIIRYLGEPCMAYEDEKECGCDDDYYQLNDTVMMAMEYNRRLIQSEHHVNWFGKKNMMVSRRRNLIGIVEFEKDRTTG